MVSRRRRLSAARGSAVWSLLSVWRAAASSESSSGSPSMARSSEGMSSRSSVVCSLVAAAAVPSGRGRKYMIRGLRDEDPSGTGPPTRIRKSSRDRSSTTSMPRRFVGRKLSSGFLRERSRTSRRDFSSSCRMEERSVMCGRVRFEATRLAGRMGASGGALLCVRWGDERNGGEGAGVGARGARVGGGMKDVMRVIVVASQRSYPLAVTQ